MGNRSERGATAVEYGLLVAMVGIVIGVIWAFGATLGTVFSQENSKIEACNSCSAPTP